MGRSARRRASSARPVRLQQAAAAVTARVDLHDGETEVAQPLRDGIEALPEPRDPAWLDLDAGALTVVADSQVARHAALTQVRPGFVHSRVARPSEVGPVAA